MAFNIPFVHPRARFFNPNGDPLEFGRVIFYDAGTTTLKEIYSDKTTTTPAPNPHELDADGFVQDGGVWLGEGRYDIVVQRALTIPPTQNSDWSNYWTMPDIPGAVSEIQGELTTTFVETIQDLRDIPIGTIQLVYVAGYFEAGDTGGGWFIYQPNSVQTDDGGAFIAPTGAGAQGRYHRIFEEAYTAAMWGALESNPSPVDANLVNAADYCETVQTPLTLTGQGLELSGNVTLSQEIHIIVQSGAFFSSSTAAVVRLQNKSIEFQGVGLLITGNAELYIEPVIPTDVYPDFWGADDTSMFNELSGHYGNCVLVVSRPYNASSLLGGLTLDRLRFESNGSITISADLVLNHPYEFPEGASLLFNLINLGVFNTISSAYPVVYGHHFSTTPNDTIYQAIIDGATDIQSRKGVVIWEGVITFNSTTIANTLGLTTRVVSRETNLILSGTENTAFGIVDAGQFQIFDISSVNDPAIDNSAKGVWFGLYEGMNPSDAVSALKRTLDIRFSLNYGVVDYEGMRIELDATAVQSSTTNNKLLKNGYFEKASSFTGTELIDFNQSVKITNFFLRGDTVSPFIVGSDCERFELRDSEISGDLPFIINADTTVLRGNQIDCEGQNQSIRNTWIEFNEFSKYYNIIDPVRVLVHGNDWSDGDATNGNLELSATTAGYTAFDVRIKNNTFAFPTSTSIPSIKASTNMAASGHVAEIFGNQFSNVWEASTRFTFSCIIIAKGTAKRNWTVTNNLQEVSILLPRVDLSSDMSGNNPIKVQFSTFTASSSEPIYYGWNLKDATITPATGQVELTINAVAQDAASVDLSGIIDFSWLDDNFARCSST